MLRFSEEFLEVSTSKFTHRVHEVNDRTVVTLNDDTRWAVMWKVSRCHKNSVGSAYCFSVGGIRTGEKRDGKGVQESKTLSSVFPQDNAGATNSMFTEGPAIKLNDEVKVVDWRVTYKQGSSSVKVGKGCKVTMNATASTQFKLYITVGRA